MCHTERMFWKVLVSVLGYNNKIFCDTEKMNKHSYYFTNHPLFRKALSPSILIKKWIDDKIVSWWLCRWIPHRTLHWSDSLLEPSGSWVPWWVLMALTTFPWGHHPLETPPLGSHTHGLRSPLSAQHWDLSPCLRYVIRMPVSSPATAYSRACPGSPSFQTLTRGFLLLFKEERVIELIATAEQCHLKLALWKDKKGLCPTVLEFSKMDFPRTGYGGHISATVL